MIKTFEQFSSNRKIQSVTYDSIEELKRDLVEEDVFFLSRDKGLEVIKGVNDYNIIHTMSFGIGNMFTDFDFKRLLQSGIFYKIDQRMAEFIKTLTRANGPNSWHKLVPPTSGGPDSPFRVFGMRPPKFSFLPNGTFLVKLNLPRKVRHPDEYGKLTEIEQNAIQRIEQIEDVIFNIAEKAEKAGFTYEIGANEIKEEVKRFLK